MPHKTGFWPGEGFRVGPFDRPSNVSITASAGEGFTWTGSFRVTATSEGGAGLEIRNAKNCAVRLVALPGRGRFDLVRLAPGETAVVLAGTVQAVRYLE